MVCGDRIDDTRREIRLQCDRRADGRVRTLDFVVDGLADVVEEAAHLGDHDVPAQLRGDDRRKGTRLDRVEQHVLAVAGPVLQPAQQLDDIGRQARNAGIVGSLLTRLANDDVDLGPGLGHDFLDSAGMDAPVAHELHERNASDLATHRVEPGQHHGFGRVVDDQVDTRGLFEGPNVAPLTADDPALHLVAREMNHGHGVFGGVVRGDALHRGHDDVAGLVVGLVAGAPLDRSRDLDRIVLGLFSDRLDEHRLRVIGSETADLLERRHALGIEPTEVFSLPLEVQFPLQQLPIALFEHVGPLVELLVPGGQTPLDGGQLAPARPSFLLGFPEQADLVFLGLEDEVLLLGSSVGDDPSGFFLGDLDRLVCPPASCHETNGHTNGQRHEGDGHKVFHLFLPSGRSGRTRVVRCNGRRDGVTPRAPASVARSLLRTGPRAKERFVVHHRGAGAGPGGGNAAGMANGDAH